MAENQAVVITYDWSFEANLAVREGANDTALIAPQIEGQVEHFLSLHQTASNFSFA